MSRDEFDALLHDLTDAAYAQADIYNLWGAENDVHDARAKLLSAYDEMAAEIERTRWRYPDRGELPDANKQVVFTTVHFCRNYNWIGDFNGELFIDDRGLHLIPKQVPRWRYVD